MLSHNNMLFVFVAAGENGVRVFALSLDLHMKCRPHHFRGGGHPWHDPLHYSVSFHTRIFDGFTFVPKKLCRYLPVVFEKIQ
jgi:hypothetical protein